MTVIVKLMRRGLVNQKEMEKTTSSSSDQLRETFPAPSIHPPRSCSEHAPIYDLPFLLEDSKDNHSRTRQGR